MRIPAKSDDALRALVAIAASDGGYVKETSTRDLLGSTSVEDLVSR